MQIELFWKSDLSPAGVIELNSAGEVVTPPPNLEEALDSLSRGVWYEGSEFDQQDGQVITASSVLKRTFPGDLRFEARLESALSRVGLCTAQFAQKLSQYRTGKSGTSRRRLKA